MVSICIALELSWLSTFLSEAICRSLFGIASDVTAPTYAEL
jgi:hypothetical protein